MDDWSYTSRPSIFGGDVTWRLTEEGLVGPRRSLDFRAVRSLRVYDAPGATINGATVPGSRRCVLRGPGGRACVLDSKHMLGIGRSEDRAASLRPFVAELIRRVAAASPGTAFRTGLPPGLWWSWAVIVLVGLLLALLGWLVALGTFVEQGVGFGVLVGAVVALAWSLGMLGFVPVLRRNRSRQVTATELAAL